MIKTTRKLHLMALVPEFEGDTLEYYRINFPGVWYENLILLFKEVAGEKAKSLPTNSLKSSIRALPIGIIDIKEIRRNYSNNNIDNWLIADKDLNIKEIFKIFQCWYHKEFVERAANKEKIIRAFGKFNENDLVCEKRNVVIKNHKTHANNTVDLEGSYYQVVPNYITTIVAREHIPIVVNGVSYLFKKCGNELISYPPIEHKGHYFSLGITIKVKTIANYNKPIIMINSSVKRWANGELMNKLSYKIDTGVYILNNNKFEGEHFELSKEKIKNCGKEKGFQWGDNIKSILEEVRLVDLPEIEELKEFSHEYINGKGDFSFLVSYNVHNAFDHKVKTGISMEEKRQILNEFQSKISFLNFMDTKNFRDVRKILNGCHQAKTNKIIGKEYAGYLKNKFEEITLEIFYQSESTLNYLLSYIEEYFDSKYIEKSIYVDDFKININSVYLGGLADNLTYENSYNKRVKDIERKFGETNGVVATIVELENNYIKDDEDPKFAIRKGLYKTGRVNQFITPIKCYEKEKDKIKNTIQELFRQLGVMVGEININSLKSLPNKFDIIGVTLISKNKTTKKAAVNTPIAVRLSTKDNNILVKTPLSDKWMDYREAILFIGSYDFPKKFGEYNPKYLVGNGIKEFFNNILKDANQSDSLLVVDGSNNIKNSIVELQDKSLMINNCFNDFHNVRIVRVKNGDDIPDYFSLNQKDEAYFISGIREVMENIFYSLTGKLVTYKTISKNYIRVDKPGKLIKYPSILEIVPMKLKESDNKDELVSLVHKMKNMHNTYNDEVLLPIPIHLANKLSEVLEVK